uniref:Uncharacterized protein n=1 Tax=Vitis vinifera TaxID=29760 RepID=A5BCX0_VITVI|nr:hypothetical protein VITISV_030171 [Vitis vinifera]
MNGSSLNLQSPKYWFESPNAATGGRVPITDPSVVEADESLFESLGDESAIVGKSPGAKSDADKEPGGIKRINDSDNPITIIKISGNHFKTISGMRIGTPHRLSIKCAFKISLERYLRVRVQGKWVLPATVKATLLVWDGSFVGKKRKDVWRASPLCLFWTVWKARNKVAFEEEELSIQRLKNSFVYLLWSETKLFIKYGLSTLVDFIDWVGTR